jgi:hypothetical protein
MQEKFVRESFIQSILINPMRVSYLKGGWEVMGDLSIFREKIILRGMVRMSMSLRGIVARGFIPGLLGLCIPMFKPREVIGL